MDLAMSTSLEWKGKHAEVIGIHRRDGKVFSYMLRIQGKRSVSYRWISVKQLARQGYSVVSVLQEV